MRVKDVAVRLDLSMSCVYQLLQAGLLKGSRHGLRRGTWRVSEEQLAEYLNRSVPEPECKVPAPQGGVFSHLNAAKLREAWKSP
jgi:excisionase family DNA binding protein